MAQPDRLLLRDSFWTIPAARLRPSELTQMEPIQIYTSALSDGLERARIREEEHNGTLAAWEKVHQEYANPEVQTLLREGEVSFAKALLSGLDLLAGGKLPENFTIAPFLRE